MTLSKGSRVHKGSFDNFMRRFRKKRREQRDKRWTLTEVARTFHMSGSQAKKYLEEAERQRRVRCVKVFYDKGTLKLRSPQIFWDLVDE